MSNLCLLAKQEDRIHKAHGQKCYDGVANKNAEMTLQFAVCKNCLPCK